MALDRHEHVGPFLAVMGMLLSVAPLHGVPFPDEELEARVRGLADQYFAGFQHPETHVLYGARLSGRTKWTKPEEVLREQPHPWGYGSRIADTALHTGHMLVALLEAWEARPAPWLRDQIRKHVAALRFIGSLPETHPKAGKPALRGLVPRGPHPDDPSAWYDDSSMDQHTTYIISLARYAMSDLASEEDRAWIRDSLGKVGERLEGNDWGIFRADGVTRAHVGFSWKGFNSNHASILLPTVLALYRGTSNVHWMEAYESFLAERDGLRWEKMHPGPHVRINGHPIYANQNAFRLSSYLTFEEEPARREVIRALLDQSIDLQMTRDFPGAFYRRFHPEETWERVRRVGGWPDGDLHGAMDAWDRFEPSLLTGTEAGLAALAHVRFPLGAFHMALLGGPPQRAREVVPAVWKMLTEVDLARIDAGETHYLFTVVGLHLYARHFQEMAAVEPEPFGEPLEIARDVGIGAVMDVVGEGDRAFAIGRGKLFVLDIADRSLPRLVGTLAGLGRVRQVLVRENLVYVTSRQDGLFVVDASDPAGPELLCHYDTVEFATGIALSGDVLFVACRNFGVELIDVRDPRRPAHLSLVRTGEAQSVVARNGFLYAGVWASSEVVVVDVHDPREPRITARLPLDGYGDGVDVREGHLHVATGHHSRARPKAKPGDPGYGHGHGLEIFHLENPAEPVFVSRVKFPPFYAIGNDMWSVTVAKGRAFVADTHNGLFVVDVTRPEAPRIEARCELPWVPSRKVRGFVGGLALTDDHVYLAGGYTDLHVVELPGKVVAPTRERDMAPRIGPAQEKSGKPGEGRRIYRPEGQVRGLDFLEDGRAVVACGQGGLHLVEASPGIRVVSVHPTEGLAMDVAVSGPWIYLAEGAGGLSVWSVSAEGDRLVERGRIPEAGGAVRQVEVLGNGRYLAITEGASRFKLFDLGAPAVPELLLADTQHGLLYGDQIMKGLVEGRYAAVFWHVSGVHWYDLEAEPAPLRTDQWAERFGSKNGLVSLGNRALVTVRGGYVLLERGETGTLDEVPIRRLGMPRRELGRPTVWGDRLFCAERATGLITIADISNPEEPVLLQQFETAGNPGTIAVTEALVGIPNGYEGLLILERGGGNDF